MAALPEEEPINTFAAGVSPQLCLSFILILGRCGHRPLRIVTLSNFVVSHRPLRIVTLSNFIVGHRPLRIMLLSYLYVVLIFILIVWWNSRITPRKSYVIFFALRRKITDYFLRSLKKTASPLIGKGRKFYIAESNAALIVLAGTISTSDLIFEFRFL